MKKSLYILVLILLFMMANPDAIHADSSHIQICGETGILIDADTGDILYEKDAHKKMYPASTTKIMTALLVLEACELDEIVTIDAETPFTEGSRIYLIEGEQITIKDLLYSLLLESANDSAVALAKHIAGTEEEFVRLMNEKAKELGAHDTNFVNPNGLPDENHVSTAYDLSLMAQEAMKNEEFRRIVSYSKTYTIYPTEKQEARYFRTRNRLMWDTSASIYYDGKYIAPKFEGATGIKTGYTVAAGSCIVSSAKDNNREIIAVILKSNPNELYADAHRLLNYGLLSFKNIEVVKKGEHIENAEVINGKTKTIDIFAGESFVKTMDIDIAEDNIQKEISIDKIFAPILKDEIVGKMIIKYEGEVIGETILLALNDVEKKLISTVGDKIKASPLGIILKVIMVLLVLYGVFIIKSNIRRKKRRLARRRRYGL